MNKETMTPKEQLLDELIRAASDNNEFDNRSKLEYLRKEVLKRMR